MESYNPVKQEPETLNFWKNNKTYEKAKDKNKGKKPFYFLDGPPYTSGKVHLGTAWNKSLKDMALRYKRMQGFDVWDRAGYDMHGMPTEQGTEKKLGIKNKEEILKFGIGNFVKECRVFSETNLLLMNKDFKRLGVWMDFDNAYKSVDNNYIQGEWWLIKKAHENKRLYEGQKTMHWCPKCATSLAKHELEYKNLNDYSIFVKFKVRNKNNEFLIVWTTTPWTIPFNLAVMAHPDFEYIRAKVDNEIWIVAKNLSTNLIKETLKKKYEVLEEFKGKELKGLKYTHPFSDIINYNDFEQKSPNVHSIILSDEFVTTEEGSGLVHTAPGCGPEDYEIGHRNNIPPFNTLDDFGVFPENIPEIGKLKAKIHDNKFIELLGKKNALLHKSKISHEYPHCWRCKEAVIFKTTTQWFFKIEDLKEKMRAINKQIIWVPEYAGTKSFDNWLENLRDNGITRQRFWGTPLPIWRCKKCLDTIIIGSIEELKVFADVPEDLHKPWIDNVKIKCKCGSVKERIPDILDVWIDAGSASWNCLDFPKRKELFNKLYPADFILEGIDQIRGWFNLLFVASMIAFNNKSFKSVYMHGFINDAQGRKMSKSLRNYILPEEVIDKYGADTFRYYSISSADAGLDLNYNFEDMKVKYKNLTVLWNIHNFIIDLAKNLKANPNEIKINKNDFSIEEKYILSKLNSTIRKTTELFEKYRLNEVPSHIEEFYLQLSRAYIQITRDKIAKGSESDKKVILWTTFNSLMDTLKIFSPIAPFITEKIYQNLKKEFSLKEESIHHFSWPKFDEKLINKEIELDFDNIANIIQASLSMREKMQLGVRWPLKSLIISTQDKKIIKSIESLKDIIKKEINVKEIDIVSELSGIKLSIKPDYSQIGPDFGNKAPKVVARLMIESPQSILAHFQKNKKFPMDIDGEKINIVKEHVIVQREIPKPFMESTFKSGFIYLNSSLSAELESEGFAREIMRRIQSLRKKNHFEKRDKISLHIKTNPESMKMLETWKTAIKEKVNATTINISELNPAKKLKTYSKEIIRDREFEIFFQKI